MPAFYRHQSLLLIGQQQTKQHTPTPTLHTTATHDPFLFWPLHFYMTVLQLLVVIRIKKPDIPETPGTPGTPKTPESRNVEPFVFVSLIKLQTKCTILHTLTSTLHPPQKNRNRAEKKHTHPKLTIPSAN